MRIWNPENATFTHGGNEECVAGPIHVGDRDVAETWHEKSTRRIISGDPRRQELNIVVLEMDADLPKAVKKIDRLGRQLADQAGSQ